MASELFWQRSMRWWTWEHLQAFCDEGNREGSRLEYKAPSYNKQSKKWENTPELLETLVALANTGDGLLLIGVSEGTDKKSPGKIVGVDHRDPESALRNWCAQDIEPTLPLEIQVVRIPGGETHAGNAVVVVRVRRGDNPPYSLCKHRVFVREDDQDRQATVRDLQGLFERRVPPSIPGASPWKHVQDIAFSHANAQDVSLPVVVGIALGPVFPGSPAILTEQAEHHFSRIIRTALEVHDAPFLEAEGFSYVAPYGSPRQESVRHATALSDGSIGLQREVPDTVATDAEARQISITSLWRTLVLLLHEAQQWPQDVLDITGPLQYAIGVGNLTDSYLVLDEATRSSCGISANDAQMPQRRNVNLYWFKSGEWDDVETAQDVIEREFESLARMLQCRYYPKLRPYLDALISKGP